MTLLQTFWWPVALRMLAVIVGTGSLWLWRGPAAALGAALTLLVATIALQGYFLFRLSAWLDQSNCDCAPRGWGIWSTVFSRLYKLRRVDERNRSELAEWLARFKQAMNILPDGVVIMSDLLTLEWCNPAAERHLCLEPERDEGNRITNLVRHPEFIDYLLHKEYHQPLTLSLQEHKLIVRLLPFERNRQILVTHEVTEAERIDRMRRDFIANASHELRTPLTVINGFLEIALAQPELDEPTRLAHLTMMADQGKRMQNLIEDMLALTKLESDHCPLHPKPVDVKQLLGQVFQEAHAMSGGLHRIEMRVEAPDILGNRDELHSAFSNLLSNAVRYTPPPGSITMTWRLAPGGPQLVVQDSGIGIGPEHISRLTERFYRVDTGRSRATKGTGLGLAIVKRVLLRHRATLVIESMPSRGSTFLVQFSSDMLECRTQDAVPLALRCEHRA